MTKLEKKISYVFGDITLLEEALRHSSYANEQGMDRIESNERFEFLGDSVLSLIVSEHLFDKRPKLPEGELTKQRATLVCETTLAKFAGDIGLGDAIMLGHGEMLGEGFKRPSTLANGFEALLAAIFLDGGMEPARYFVLRLIKRHEAAYFEDSLDYKTQLQEVIQQNREERIRYVVASTDGPEHDKSFTVHVMLNSNVIGRGTGHSKKQAEQLAAREALELMGL